MKKVYKLAEYLTVEKVEEITKGNNTVEEIAKIAEVYGYNAVATEIRHNRRARDNFNYIIDKGFLFLDLTKEDYKLVQKLKNILKELSELLPNNNAKQLEYLRLKQDYENATFRLSEQYTKLDILESRSDDWKKEHEKLDHYNFEFKQAMNKLDDFVLNNL